MILFISNKNKTFKFNTTNLSQMEYKMKAFCQNCFRWFETEGIGRYAQCPRCRSKTTNFSESEEYVEKNMKVVVACHCGHVWLTKNSQWEKKRHCPKCKHHTTKWRFRTYFKNKLRREPDIMRRRMERCLKRSGYIYYRREAVKLGVLKVKDIPINFRLSKEEYSYK